MIVLDTNVVSELMKPEFDPKVFAWVERLPVETLFCTAITKAEILYGIEILPAGRRKRELHDAVAAVFDRELRGRILPFDDRAADRFAVMLAARKRSGRPMSLADAQICAIALANQMTLATRNVADFSPSDLTLVDPWQDTL